MKPFITCLCVTRNRPDWLIAAVACFQARMFSDAELLIVADGDIVSDNFGDSRVRVVNLPSRPKTLGDKRNIGCDLASGEVIAIWDDDDHHCPTRLSDQINTMVRSGLPVTAYNRMKFTDGINWWVYDGILQSVGIGGSLCFTKNFWAHNNFPSLNEAEDNEFIRMAWERREFIATPACAENSMAGIERRDKMHATIHPGNTSIRDVRPGSNYRLLGVSSALGCVLGTVQAAKCR